MPNPRNTGLVFNSCTTAPVIRYAYLTAQFCVTFLQAWALFKGKFREGIDKPDPPTWKTRLRCALNKSNDFEELVEKSQLDISDPYKVYRIIPEGAKRRQYNYILSILENSINSTQYSINLSGIPIHAINGSCMNENDENKLSKVIKSTSCFYHILYTTISRKGG